MYNNNGSRFRSDLVLTCATVAIINSVVCLVVVRTPMGIPGRFQRDASLRTAVVQTKLWTNRNINQKTSANFNRDVQLYGTFCATCEVVLGNDVRVT